MSEYRISKEAIEELAYKHKKIHVSYLGKQLDIYETRQEAYSRGFWQAYQLIKKSEGS